LGIGDHNFYFFLNKQFNLEKFQKTEKWNKSLLNCFIPSSFYKKQTNSNNTNQTTTTPNNTEDDYYNFPAFNTRTRTGVIIYFNLVIYCAGPAPPPA